VAAFEKLRVRIIATTDKVLFDEAVKCYDAGAYRAAYVFAWIAAAEGILAKLRTMGAVHAEIGNFVASFEARQKTGDAKDAELLDKASSIGFVDPTETRALSAIRELRNQYGHPTAAAPTGAGATFAIETIVDAVLAKHPLLLHGAAKELANRLGTDHHFLPHDRGAVVTWTLARVALIHPAARPLFIKTLIEHHAAGLLAVGEMLSDRCRQVAVTSLTDWQDRLDATPWQVDRLQQDYPASAADVFTDLDVWPLLGPDDQYRLLSRCLDTTTASTQPNLTRRLISRAFELDEAQMLSAEQAKLLEDGVGRIDGMWLATANVPVDRIVPKITALLADGSFRENKEGTQLLEAVRRDELASADPELLRGLGQSLAAAARRGAYVAINLLSSIVGSPFDWPLEMRIAAATEGATEPWLFYDATVARLAVGLALADPAVAVALLAAMPDPADETLGVGHKAMEVIEKMEDSVAGAAVTVASNVRAVFETVEAAYRRQFGER
jgi:hypothetical protein